MLATRAIAKVFSPNQNCCFAKTRLIEFEVRIFTPVGMKTPIEKQKLTEPRALDPFEKLFGNDLIGVDVGTIHRCSDASMFCKSLH